MASRFKKITGITVAGAMAVTLIGGFEGLRLNSYPDVIGVWTACYGTTKGIKPGMKFTKEQCDAIFIEELVQHEEGMRKCLKTPDAVPDKPYIAYVSLTYNIGVGGFCKSSLPALINAGKYREACGRLLSFNKAGGKVVKGLTNRREQEKKFCLSGL
ncbi:MAG: lysozyme [Rhodovulum sulfidophilum]|uniref:Lysozyme n=1 Tax=Rhodovulum sulfidophilum TaxID=35806 RepID=A0A2W5N2A3_RHOSU|nr:MAG: lysozyme [Rhodovulum sulfidophilum]